MYPENRLEDALGRLGQRRSVKAMDICEPGPGPDDLQMILTIGARVPDHGKLGPWRFICFQDDARIDFGNILAERYKDLNPEAKPKNIVAERNRLTRAPVVVCVVADVKPHAKIPEWEQQLSVGAVCQNILVAASLAGYAAQWLTEWYAFDPVINGALQLLSSERVAGFIYLGSAAEKPAERVRPELQDRLTHWSAPKDTNT
ncbi:MAG: nitroreductase [Pseudomonadaceae bacterium]|nr:nitroreductase [Pseudomonadaceae bacterium]